MSALRVPQIFHIQYIVCVHLWPAGGYVCSWSLEKSFFSSGLRHPGMSHSYKFRYTRVLSNRLCRCWYGDCYFLQAALKWLLGLIKRTRVAVWLSSALGGTLGQPDNLAAHREVLLFEPPVLSLSWHFSYLWRHHVKRPDKDIFTLQRRHHQGSRFKHMGMIFRQSRSFKGKHYLPLCYKDNRTWHLGHSFLQQGKKHALRITTNRWEVLFLIICHFVKWWIEQWWRCVSVKNSVMPSLYIRGSQKQQTLIIHMKRNCTDYVERTKCARSKLPQHHQWFQIKQTEWTKKFSSCQAGK